MFTWGIQLNLFLYNSHPGAELTGHYREVAIAARFQYEQKVWIDIALGQSGLAAVEGWP